jgi:hypothetical protein
MRRQNGNSIFAQNAGCGHRTGSAAVHNDVSFRVAVAAPADKNCSMKYLASRASEFGVPPVTGASAAAAYMSGRKADLAGQGSGP